MDRAREVGDMFNLVDQAKRRRLSDRRRGAETLELALALPLLLVLAFGTIEFGYWFYLEHNFQAAAREGARAAIVASLSNLADRQAAAEDAADAIMLELKIPKANYQVNTTPSPDGNYLTVEIKADWKDIGVETGLFMKMHGSSQGTELVDDQAKIIGTATMRIES
jgi:Flp pilus assembly protein TadG